MRATIAVLGTLTRDTTVYADGARSENLGGTHYSILTLAHLFQGRAHILPLANVGADTWSDVHEALALPGVDLAGLRRVEGPNNHVYLTYTSATERDEVLVGLVPPLTESELLALPAVDWALVNLTSGRDVTLAGLRALRGRVRGTVQLDIHSLTLGFAPDGRRYLRRPADWEQWAACADWVQMNEAEARLLGEDDELQSFAARILELGPRGVLVTLGGSGCFGCWREAGAVRRLAIPASRQPQPAFPTGCGDVFGAAFAFAMMAGAAPEAALRFANAAAGAKACHEPYAALRSLRREVAPELGRFVPSAAQG